MAKLAKLATAVAAVEAGDNKLTFVDGIKYLSDVVFAIFLGIT